jgi:hypothetical protein
MNLIKALHVFTLGVRFGDRQSRLGLVIDKMTDERLAEILNEGFMEHQNEIETFSKSIQRIAQYHDWYTQHWTAKQSYRFGLLDGFNQCEKTKPDKKGLKLLTEDVIDRLTQNQFKSCKTYAEGQE